MTGCVTKKDIAAIASAIAEDLVANHEVSVGAEPLNISENRHGAGCELQVEKSYGIFSMIIADARIQLRAEPVEDGTFWVQASLNYNHHGGGSNGHEIATYWIRNGKIENVRRI